MEAEVPSSAALYLLDGGDRVAASAVAKAGLVFHFKGNGIYRGRDEPLYDLTILLPRNGYELFTQMAEGEGLRGKVEEALRQAMFPGHWVGDIEYGIGYPDLNE